MLQLRLSREPGAKGDDIVHRPRIGATTNDQRLAFCVAGLPAVDVHQRCNQWVICRNVDGQLALAFDDPQIIGGSDFGDAIIDLIRVKCDRIADIDGESDRTLVQFDHARIPDQRTGSLIRQCAADSLAVHVKADVVTVEPDEVRHIVIGKMEHAQNVHQNRDGVQTALRFGTVGGCSLGTDLQTLSNAFEENLMTSLFPQGGNHRLDLIISR